LIDVSSVGGYELLLLLQDHGDQLFVSLPDPLEITLFLIEEVEVALRDVFVAEELL
jgi:hypothetical protein